MLEFPIVYKFAVSFTWGSILPKTFDTFSQDHQSSVRELAKLSFLSADTLAFGEYWFSRPRVDFVPDRSDIDPTDIPSLLSNLLIYEYEGPYNLRIRLAGTSLVARHGREITGLNLMDMVPPENYEDASWLFQQIVTQPCGCLSHGHAKSLSGRRVHFEILFFPARNRQGKIDQIVAHSIGKEPDRYYDTASERVAETKEFQRALIDIGAGVPDDPRKAK
ncbi:MAG: PAS domain-containing protein [Rhodospirillaceae bacterium]|nr:PAS domain-containing protein [Rhodospirillaceae bacterium]